MNAGAVTLLLILRLLLPPASAVSFNFSRFPHKTFHNITYQGDATASVDDVIELTRNQADGTLQQSRGWAVYSEPVRLWDAATGNLTSFTTTFSFFFLNLTGERHGDGFAFFLAPNGSTIPNGTRGGTLALFDDGVDKSGLPGSGKVVAVEFDTFQNFWDPPSDHMGIDVGSIVSRVNTSWAHFSLWANATLHATVTYDASAMNLSASLTDKEGLVRSLNYRVDLRRELPEWVTVGFSATTGVYVEIHRIRSWSFFSSLDGGSGIAPARPPPSPDYPPRKNGNSRTGLLAGLIAGFTFLAAAAAAALVWFFIWPRKRQSNEELAMVDDREIEEGRGPKRFTHRELGRATRNFAPDGKLGRGGFGEVYKGFLHDLGLDVAVKRVSRDSRQGKKEYLSEINIIGKLRHRNLVRLLGWCHDQGELLLVYEYLPNGSLDAHLFGDSASSVLTWPTRYNIAQGLASALLYLHEGWDQCVVHRDVKSSNVMLDADFNPKLGDFGLARLVDHGVGMQTTAPAGTWGYVAPECVTGGKARRESDVYSFGVVTLEIVCGRKAIDQMAEEEKVMLVGWVWGLYGQHALLDAVDERLHFEFDKAQVEQLMMVALWCAHPDPNSRPSMRQVAGALNFESMPPRLPDQMPVLTYVPPASCWHGVAQSSSQSGSSASATAMSCTLPR